MVADAIFKFFEAVAKLQNFWFAELTGQFFFKFLNLQSKIVDSKNSHNVHNIDSFNLFYSRIPIGKAKMLKSVTETNVTLGVRLSPIKTKVM